MGIVSCESRSHWEAMKKRRTTQTLSLQESALLLLQNQPAKKRRFVSRIPPMEKKEMPLLQRFENPKPLEELKVLGKRQRLCDDSGDCMKKRLRQDDDDDADVEKRRRIHQDQLRKRRQDEILKQKGAEELRKKNQQGGIFFQREAARKSLEVEERKAKENVVDYHKDFWEKGNSSVKRVSPSNCLIENLRAENHRISEVTVNQPGCLRPWRGKLAYIRWPGLKLCYFGHE